MGVEKGNFIEIEFTGKISETGKVFDTTNKKVAQESGIDTKDIKPFLLCVGHKMLPPGLDSDLKGKEVGKEYEVELNPEAAFGRRNPTLVQTVPLKFFQSQNINPQRGMQLSIDGKLARVLSSSGGRVLVDFNHPLAGKKVTYTYKILRMITDEKEKVNALQDFFFKQRFDFDIKEKNIIFKGDRNVEPIILLFKNKFKEILGFEISFEEKDRKISLDTTKS
ncbi:peptidylprolyl isomerase [Candidatus Pacearchaeota archaeon]|nr:MAG: peptidylprolyl isomerase [Candidatus Pacearchaeota archaeon]